MTKNTSKHKMLYTGVGLVLGVGFGTVLFAITGEAWYIGVGAGVGLIIGAIIDSVSKK